MSSVFTAMADPTRRQILERLRTSGPLSVNEIANPLPMSRQAVTKHLDVLRDAGLVQVRRSGRQRLHELDAQPLRELEEFLEPYAAFWDDRLQRLQRHLGEEP